MRVIVAVAVLLLPGMASAATINLETVSIAPYPFFVVGGAVGLVAAFCLMIRRLKQLMRGSS